jgi:hypothetical protein
MICDIQVSSVGTQDSSVSNRGSSTGTQSASQGALRYHQCHSGIVNIGTLSEPISDTQRSVGTLSALMSSEHSDIISNTHVSSVGNQSSSVTLKDQ